MEALITKVNALLGRLCVQCDVPCDKQSHAFVGFVVALALTPFIGVFSLIVVGLLAAWKEVYDYLNKEKHTPDLWDWIATVAGGIVGYLPYIKI